MLLNTVCDDYTSYADCRGKAADHSRSPSVNAKSRCFNVSLARTKTSNFKVTRDLLTTTATIKRIVARLPSIRSGRNIYRKRSVLNLTIDKRSVLMETPQQPQNEVCLPTLTKPVTENEPMDIVQLLRSKRSRAVTEMKKRKKHSACDVLSAQTRHRVFIRNNRDTIKNIISRGNITLLAPPPEVSRTVLDNVLRNRGPQQPEQLLRARSPVRLVRRLQTRDRVEEEANNEHEHLSNTSTVVASPRENVRVVAEADNVSTEGGD